MGKKICELSIPENLVMTSTSVRTDFLGSGKQFARTFGVGESRDVLGGKS